MLKAIIFDGDDTLWHTEWLYDEARRHARQIVEREGLDGERWEARERLLDVENVSHLGHSAERFPSSCVTAYEEECAIEGRAVDEGARRSVGDAARTVFGRPAPLVSGARETLEALKARGLLLALLTKGDPLVQVQRIEQSGLRPIFDLVEVVEEKTSESILATVGRLGVSPGEALTVGNSARSDVLPSLAAGITPVWIDAHVWEYERDHNQIPEENVIKREDLSALLEISTP
ncbi:MAG: HAD family hydrolase [Solirubrobacterales bacterium]